MVCDDGVACTVDGCDEETDSCSNTASDVACDDGIFCNGAETCDYENGCVAGTAVDCGGNVGHSVVRLTGTLRVKPGVCD